MVGLPGKKRKLKTTLSGLMVLIVFASLARAHTGVPVDHYWGGVLQAYACVNITQSLSGWTAHLVFDADIASIEVWDAVQTKVNARDFKLTNQHYNAEQEAGNTLCIYFRGHLAVRADAAPSISIYIEGMDGPTSGPESGTTLQPTSPTTIGPAAPGKRFNVQVVNEWPGGFQGRACVTVYQHMQGWRGRLKFKAPGVTEIQSIWRASATRLSKRHYVLHNMDYNAVLEPGDGVCVGFVAECRCSTAPAAKIFIEGNTRRRQTTRSPTTQAPSTQAPSTQAPSTQATSTQAPSTQAPSTQAPSTQAPSTQAPSTQAPSTQAPSTQAPSTQAPSTQAPSTQAPSTQAPSTQAPSTQAPSTQAPSTQAPSTQAPSTQAPSTQAPSTQAPSTQAPSTQAPSTQAPTTQAPSTQAPSTQAPSTQAPTTQAPSTQAPSTQAPSTQAPSTQAPSTQAPSTQAPSTQAPTTQAPSTQAPSTQAPSTQAPSTQAPSTQAPSTQAPSTQAPSTQAPSTQAPSTQAPSTQAPSTQAPSTQAPSTQAPSTQALSTQTPATTPSSATEIPVAVPVSNEWNGGFQADPCIDIYNDLNGWTAHLHFGSDIDSVEVWVATPTRVTPTHFQLDDLNGDELRAGDRLCFTFVARCSCTQAPLISIYIEGNIGGGGNGGGENGGGSGGAGNATKDYNEALRLSILFYAAQRSGSLPEDNPIPWRGDSAVSDCVPGGWYDAGDHVKFGLPMASSTTLLTWSLVQFKNGYQKAGQLDAMYDSIRWPLDYFLDAWDESASRLLVQVGDGNADHAYWGRAEEMDMARPCQYVSASNKGSDIAAETAAAMAVGALAFQDKEDQAYSDQLLNAAESLYNFAKNNRGLFGGAAPFYSSSGDDDELCVAAMFLYKATGTADYLAHAQSFLNPGTSWSLSWDNKFIACQILLYEETGQYKSNIQSFFRSWSQDGGMSYTPCGLAWRDSWGSTRYAGNAAFTALVAADVGIDSESNRKWAVEQINYILGDNRVNGQCFSFVVGYGSNYPQQPHHRGASCPDLPAPCGWNQESASTPNPQILHGALVGGPDNSGNYNDDRSDYISNEVATDYNSGFQGALAGISQLEDGVDFPKTDNKCPCGV
ncbi:hypothetical protein RRG08_049108 [Elysia crispata]|uniref:Endoglucanase n=1 Tax=Elysia crispata TaxID=231223 RepID=A0AAE0YVU4_9GAST|nr:hypothetical protein RRG08_049108 [Elysia crispata]